MIAKQYPRLRIRKLPTDGGTMEWFVLLLVGPGRPVKHCHCLSYDDARWLAPHVWAYRSFWLPR